MNSSSKLNLIIPDLDELKSGENTYADRIWYSKEGKIWHFFIHEPIMDTMNRGSMYTQKTNRIILHAFQLLIQVSEADISSCCVHVRDLGDSEC